MKKISCGACNKDWGHSYCGVCKGVGYVFVSEKTSPQNEFDAEENRKELLLDAQQDYENLEEQFGPKSIGNHELLDRASLLLNNWEQFVLEHPSCVLNKELFEKAYVINSLMAEFYQNVGQQE